MTRTETHDAAQRSGWVGWIYFAGIVLLIGAAIDIIYGLMAIIGLAMVVLAFFLLTGRTWARILVTIVVAINAVSHVLSLPAQPWWAIIMIALDVLVIYAVTVHGRELRS